MVGSLVLVLHPHPTGDVLTLFVAGILAIFIFWMLTRLVGWVEEIITGRKF